MRQTDTELSRAADTSRLLSLVRVMHPIPVLLLLLVDKMATPRLWLNIVIFLS